MLLANVLVFILVTILQVQVPVEQLPIPIPVKQQQIPIGIPVQHQQVPIGITSGITSGITLPTQAPTVVPVSKVSIQIPVPVTYFKSNKLHQVLQQEQEHQKRKDKMAGLAATTITLSADAPYDTWIFKWDKHGD